MSPLDALSEMETNGWYAGPRSEIDVQIERVLRTALATTEFPTVYAAAFPDHEQVLSAFAERACSWSVHDRNPDTAALALLATYLSGADGRSRDASIPVPLIRRCCKLANMSYDEVVAKAIKLVGKRHGKLFRMFAEAPTPSPEDMGYSTRDERPDVTLFVRRSDRRNVNRSEAWWQVAVAPPAVSGAAAMESDASRLERIRRDVELRRQQGPKSP